MTSAIRILSHARRRAGGWRFNLSRPRFSRPRFGWLEWVFLLIAIIATGMRLWELDGRVMHYDEAIHLHFAWRLAQGMGFSHSPWMHGPLQIELVAALLSTLGDTDFVARLPYALFGVALVILPYFLRGLIGDKGAVCAAVILIFSPSLLYFSRFGRNDILMVVWALLLFIFCWRYTETGQRRYLYWTAPVTALMLATKETAYFVILFIGVAALALGWRTLLRFVRDRQRFSEIDGAAGFFILLATLTLPQAAAIIALAQGPLGLTLAVHDSGNTGETGAPVWEAPLVTLPVVGAGPGTAPLWLHGIAAAALVGLALAAAWWRRRRSPFELASVAVAALSTMSAVSVVVVGTIAGRYIDCGIGAALLLLAAVIIRPAATGVRSAMLLLGTVTLLTLLWLVAFHNGLSFIGQLLPQAPAADLEAGRIAVNYLVPALTLLLLLAAGAAVGIAWGGGVWLACAGIFYVVWTPLYTTAFTNWHGVFTGSWQSLGYWLAQQDVARGNQPWYYYAVGLTVYELLALVFGLAAVVWLFRRREPFGIVLAAWALATLAIYTIAAEKMPWLLVNMTVPLALAAGMLLGHLLDGIAWSQLRRRTVWLFVLAPAWLALAVWVGWLAARGDTGMQPAWLAGLVLLPLAALIAWLMRGQRHAGKVTALAIAGLLLMFGIVAAGRAAYTYDDSHLEILVYAQGSADLVDTYDELRRDLLTDSAETGAVKVDYDMWYPFQWYVRSDTQRGSLQFDRFCAAESGNDGDADKAGDNCRKVAAGAGPRAYLAEHAHAVSEAEAGEYRKDGPMRNLLWYPETYRRPGESRTDTRFRQQLAADIEFFRDAAADPAKWRAALEYIVTRHQESDWYSAEYYQYTKD